MRMRERMTVAIAGMVLGVCTLAWAQEGPGGKKPVPTPKSAEKPAAVRPTAAPAARVEVTPTEFNFGELWETMPAQATCTVRNTGDAPLTLSLRTTCGCTVATKPQTPLAPGESSTFSITYDTKRAGKADKKVILTTNDPTRPKVEIPVVGMVKVLFAATPYKGVMFRELDESSISSQTILLENKYGKPLQLKLREGQRFRKFDVVLNEIKPGMMYELEVTTKPPLDSGHNNAMVLLETGLELAPRLEIRLSANVPPRVSVTPYKLVVVSAGKQPGTRMVRVQYRVETPIKITKVEASHESVKWEFLPPVAPRAGGKLASHRMRVTLPTFAEFPATGARLTIYTDDELPQYQKLEIPLVKSARQTAVPLKRKPGAVGSVTPPAKPKPPMAASPEKPTKPGGGG